MNFIKNIFLYQFLFILSLFQVFSASSQYKFPVQAPQGTPWHPLLCAIQQANLKEVEKIMKSINKDDVIFTQYITPLSTAQNHAENTKFHPTTRQTYYQICSALEDRGDIALFPIKPMPSYDTMLQEHCHTHKLLAKRAKATADYKKSQAAKAKYIRYLFKN